jgi:GR25 family glycosyltransferase involved in LPS biosynthesis
LAEVHAAAGTPTLQISTNDFSPHLTPGAVGCALSHKLAWESFLETDAEAAIIFEDDVIALVPDLGPRLQRVLDSLPADFDICYLGYHGGLPTRYFDSPCFAPPGAARDAVSEALVDAYIRGTQLEENCVLAEGLVTGLYMYVVSRLGAKQLLDAIFPLELQVDVAVAKELPNLSAWKLPNHDTLAFSLPSQCGDTDIQILAP